MLARIARKATYANVMATIAVFIALGGTSYAAVMITGANIKDGTITAKDVKSRSLLAKNFKAGQLPAGAKGAPGSTGATGATGAAGTAGPKGDTGAAGAAGAAGHDGANGSPGTNGAPGMTGADGSPDTAAQVLAKLAGVDGAGSGLDADQLDGHHFSDAQDALKNTVVLHGDLGATANGAALLTAANTAAAGTLVFLEPGDYNLGTGTLTLPTGVSLRGSGTEQTLVYATNPTSGTVLTTASTYSGNNTVSDLRIDGSKGTAFAVVSLVNKAVKLVDVEIHASGTAAGSGTFAAVSIDGGYAEIVGSQLFAGVSSGTMSAAGVLAVNSGYATIRDSDIEVNSASGIASRAIANTSDGHLTIAHSTLGAGGSGAAFAYAVSIEGNGSGAVDVDGSDVYGRLSRIGSTPGALSLGGSKLYVGAAVSAPFGSPTCIDSYRSDHSAVLTAACT